MSALKTAAEVPSQESLPSPMFSVSHVPMVTALSWKNLTTRSNAWAVLVKVSRST
ncbi:hypothetical protein RKD39_002071 [Streptomyces albogriseolus]